MTSSKPDLLFKILIKGNYNTGKTSIINRYVTDEFYEPYLCNIGVDFKIKNIQKNDKKLKLYFWDGGGSDKYKIIISQQLRNLNGLVFAYDITDRRSFDSIKEFIDRYIECRNQDNIVLLLVGNKCDLEIQRAVSYKEGQQLADSLGMNYYEISAKSSQNVNTCFEQFIDQILLIQ